MAEAAVAGAVRPIVYNDVVVKKFIIAAMFWAIVAFLVGLAAGWSLEDGLVPALQGPLSGYLAGADLSWLAGIVIAGGLYLAIGGRTATASALAPATK